MRSLRTVAELRGHLAEVRAEGKTVGLVPTMGAFHAGHAALMRAARERCDVVVVSLFVNPTQFEEAGDLAAYPRPEAEDAIVAEGLGVEVLFAPPVTEIYPAGFATTVTVAGLSDVLEGAERGPGHFAAVCTVVAKLLNLVGPDVAFFGQKDAQQVAVVRRMARDLDFPAELAVVPTVRDADGLALSSRNARLDEADRARALGLSRGLRAAEEAVAAGERDPAPIRDRALAALRATGVRPEYLAVVDPERFSALEQVNGRALVVVAARVGAVRLIDNVLIETTTDPTTDP